MNMDEEEQQRQRPPESHPAANDQHHPPPPLHKCPRCDSFNTKFCYYNNYSLSQPRYFCKACRRYWTQGGTLRNVPVGGGCRKSKRPRTSSSPLPNNLSARTQGLAPALRPPNLTGVISGHPSRPMLPVIPPMGNSFYTNGSFLSSLAAMQSLPGSINNQGAAAMNLGGGSSQFAGNMALLQGVSLPSLKPPATAHQFQQPTTHYFPPQPNLIPPGPFGSWPSQGLINTSGATSSSADTSNVWSRNDQAGSSFDPNQWPDNHSGFNPSQ